MQKAGTARPKPKAGSSPAAATAANTANEASCKVSPPSESWPTCLNDSYDSTYSTWQKPLGTPQADVIRCLGISHVH